MPRYSACSPLPGKNLLAHREMYFFLLRFMFVHSIFDGLLYRPPTRNDIPQYEEVQRILKEELVNPLRQNNYVRADKVMKLRRLLQKLGSVKGLTNEEKGELTITSTFLCNFVYK